MAKYKSLLLASAIKDYDKLTFPKMASPKLDGVRAFVQDGVVLSRNFKPIPNAFVQKVLGQEMFDGIDGELIVGSPTDKEVFRNTMSGVMREDGEPDFKFFAFDNMSPASSKTAFESRLVCLALFTQTEAKHPNVQTVPHVWVYDAAGLAEYEAKCLAEGFEGVMLRDPKGTYKYGRSSEKEAILLKVKRFSQDEAVIIGFEERMENQNEKVMSETGKMKRTTHAEGKVGRGDLGAILVDWNGKEFSIGSGFDDALRKQIWDNQDDYQGKTVTFKFFEIGEYDKPRFPTFIGFRHPIDTPKKEK